MKYHLQILRKYLSLDTTPQDIAKNLILKTCEIEEVIERQIPRSIVIGKIEQVEKHPDADKLNICQVNCWTQGKFQIICGGTNVAEGLFVATALVGTPFPEAGITIAKRAMRGVDSEGMICSKGELGINEDKDTHWIWDLAQDLEVSDTDLGRPLSEVFPRLEATILEVDSKSLTNRPDLTGHFGVAVELNAIYPDALKKFNGIKKWIESFRDTNILEVLEHTEKPLNREVRGLSKAVNTYIALGIKNIEVKKSDFFSRLQVLDLGSNPINNWVDFSNLFMNTVGLPIHCFDADKIEGAIIIRDANEGELFTDLFGTEHRLQATDLVIADEKKVLALAGVIWGMESGITDTTKNILVELANFDPVVVRKTGTRLWLRTDAELRFEKNISPAFSLYALLLFLDELKFYAKDLWNYEIEGIASYIRPDINPLEKKLIPTPWNTLQSLIFGTEQPDSQEKATAILEGLGFWVAGDVVSVPLWRGPDDINIKEDVAEEIARIWGYDQISPQALLSEVKAQPFSESVAILRAVEQAMVEIFDFDQVETYPRVAKTQVELLWNTPDTLYTLQNPLNPEFPYLRDSMLYNLIPIVSKSSKFFDHFRIFDLGKVWKPGISEQALHLDQRYAEEHFCEELTLGACRYEKSCASRSDDPLLKMKALLTALFKRLEIKGKLFFEPSAFSCFHPKKQAKLLLRNGESLLEIGQIWSLHPFVLQKSKLPEQAQLCTLSLNLEPLKHLLHSANAEKNYETFQDQIVWRDLSFVVDAKTSFEKVITTLEKMPQISKVRLFDLYQGENLGTDKKSLAVQIKIKGDGAMTTEAINAVMQDAIKKVEATGAQLRA